MSKVQIVKNTFTNEETGEVIPYKRLAISGVIGGNMQTLEIKLNKTELMLAELLLADETDEDFIDAISQKD